MTVFGKTDAATALLDAVVTVGLLLSSPLMPLMQLAIPLFVRLLVTLGILLHGGGCGGLLILRIWPPFEKVLRWTSFDGTGAPPNGLVIGIACSLVRGCNIVA